MIIFIFYRKVLLGVTGSVATIKTEQIINELKSKIDNVEIILVPTHFSEHFLPSQVVELLKVEKIYRDEDEWSSWNGRGDPVLHIELRKWADVLVIAPLSANTLAKISNGLCDNLLTCVARAWDFSKPCLFAPAMNTFMWDHPTTQPQIDRLKSWGYIEIPCIEKVLMCKDKGKGAMAEPLTIAESVFNVLNK